MISLAQVPLMLEGNHKGIEFLEKYINPEEYVPWVRRVFPGLGYSALTWPTGFRNERPFRLNKFYWPAIGASRWAYGHFLATAEQVDEIRTAAFGSEGNKTQKIELFMESPGAPSSEFLSCDVYLLPPTPISAVPIDVENHKVNNLFILTVVDQRYYWWNKATPLVNFTDTSTWASAFAIAETALGIEITKASINSAYLNASPQLNLSYEVMPPWLDALCANVGQRLVCRTSGVFLTQTYTEALASRSSDLNNNPDRRIIAGGSRFEDEVR